MTVTHCQVRLRPDSESPDLLLGSEDVLLQPRLRGPFSSQACTASVSHRTFLDQNSLLEYHLQLPVELLVRQRCTTMYPGTGTIGSRTNTVPVVVLLSARAVLQVVVLCPYEATDSTRRAGGIPTIPGTNTCVAPDLDSPLHRQGSKRRQRVRSTQGHDDFVQDCA